jgi:hypothetical protein
VTTQAITTGPDRGADERLTPEPPAEAGPAPTAPFRVPELKLRQGGMCSPRAVAVATLLCGPMAGFLLLSLNDSVLHKRGRGWVLFLVGLLVSGLEVLGLALSSGPSFNDVTVGQRLIIPVLNLFFLFFLAVLLHGKAFDDHVRHRGKKASVGSLVGRSVLGLGLVLALSQLVSWGTELALRDSQVSIAPNKTIQHTGSVRPEEARALGKALLDRAVFEGPDEQSARLHRDGQVFEVTFWFSQTPSPEHRQYYLDLARVLSAEVFSGAPVRIRLRDSSNELRMTIESSQP